VALGSNMRHPRHGSPRAVLAAAARALSERGLRILAVAPVRETPPLGPARRRFANGAVLGLWEGSPEALLALCHAVERAFGRHRRQRRWGPRVLDCDLILLGQEVRVPKGRRRAGLVLPHPELHRRRFVLEPLAHLWPGWRHPRLGLTARQLRAIGRRSRPVDSGPAPA